VELKHPKNTRRAFSKNKTTDFIKQGTDPLKIVPSGYFRLNHWEVSVQLAREYGVAVYPCLNESRVKDIEARRGRASPASYRARATNVWDSGADGVYMFNSFNPRSPLWRELGDPKTLETMDKVYCTGARGVRAANSYVANGVRFLNRQLLSPERPAVERDMAGILSVVRDGWPRGGPQALEERHGMRVAMAGTGLSDDHAPA